jgi:hypothetical protein
MDVGPPLIAYLETMEPVEPGVRARPPNNTASTAHATRYYAERCAG